MSTLDSLHPSEEELLPCLSVVVPVYNERDNLAPLHQELSLVLEGIESPAEILYVDDGSRDGSAEVLADLAKRDRRVRRLSLAPHSGQSAALHAGFCAARGDVVATLDADLQNDPADLPRLLAALERADVASGVRIRRRDPPLRRLASHIANAFRNAVLGESVTDVGCSLRVMRRCYLEGLPAFRGMHRFLPTLLRLAGARMVELPVNHRPRRHGRSKYGIVDRLFVGLVDTLAVYWMVRRHLSYAAREDPID